MIGLSTQIFGQVSIKGITIGENFEKKDRSETIYGNRPNFYIETSIGGINGKLTIVVTNDNKVWKLIFEAKGKYTNEDYSDWIYFIEQHYKINFEKVGSNERYPELESVKNRNKFFTSKWWVRGDEPILSFTLVIINTSIYDLDQKLQKEKKYEKVKDDF